MLVHGRKMLENWSWAREILLHSPVDKFAYEIPSIFEYSGTVELIDFSSFTLQIRTFYTHTHEPRRRSWLSRKLQIYLHFTLPFLDSPTSNLKYLPIFGLGFEYKILCCLVIECKIRLVLWFRFRQCRLWKKQFSQFSTLILDLREWESGIEFIFQLNRFYHSIFRYKIRISLNVEWN